MKKLFSILIFVAVQYAVKAQPEIGVSIAPGTTWLLNNNASDQGDNLNYRTSFGIAGGLRAGYFFTSSLGISAELNYASINQKYEGKYMGTHYNAGDHLRYISVPVLFQLKTSGGFYFEVGPQFNFLSSAKGEFTLDNDPLSLNYSNREIKTGFNTSVVSGLLGLGGRFSAGDRMAILAGLRFTGSFADVTTELGQSEYDAALLNGELGTTVTFAHSDQSGNYHYEKTMSVTGSVMIGLVYVLKKKDSKK